MDHFQEYLELVLREARSLSANKVTLQDVGGGVLVVFERGDTKVHTLGFRTGLLEGMKRGITKGKYDLLLEGWAAKVTSTIVFQRQYPTMPLPSIRQ